MTNDNLEYMMAFPPQREGFMFKLWQHRLTKLYQWINDDEFAYSFDMEQIYPTPSSLGFGRGYFGRAPFGR